MFILIIYVIEIVWHRIRLCSISSSPRKSTSSNQNSSDINNKVNNYTDNNECQRDNFITIITYKRPFTQPKLSLTYALMMVNGSRQAPARETTTSGNRRQPSRLIDSRTHGKTTPSSNQLPVTVTPHWLPDPIHADNPQPHSNLHHEWTNLIGSGPWTAINQSPSKHKVTQSADWRNRGTIMTDVESTESAALSCHVNRFKTHHDQWQSPRSDMIHNEHYNDSSVRPWSRN